MGSAVSGAGHNHRKMLGLGLSMASHTRQREGKFYVRHVADRVEFSLNQGGDVGAVSGAPIRVGVEGHGQSSTLLTNLMPAPSKEPL
jgi:hypothetical protein